MIEVVISWRDHGCPHRRAALEWTLDRWDGWPVKLHGAVDGASWCRANDVTPVIERSAADIIVVADADCWTDGVADAVEAVEQGAPWAVPHLLVCRLSEGATARVLAGEHPQDQDDFAERPYKGRLAGTMFVIRRDVYLDCPLDPRFVGWGQEDEALALALSTLHGGPWRGSAPLWHLWHPPQQRLTRRIGSKAGERLLRRYKTARSSPDRMRSLVEEARGQREDQAEPSRRARAAAVR